MQRRYVCQCMYRFTISILTSKYVPTEKSKGGQFEGIVLEIQEALKEIKHCFPFIIVSWSCPAFLFLMIMIMWSFITLVVLSPLLYWLQ